MPGALNRPGRAVGRGGCTPTGGGPAPEFFCSPAGGGRPAFAACPARRDAANTPVQEAMTPDVTFVFEDQDVQDAARIMREQQIRRLPVLSRDKQLVGILALGDIATTGDD